MKKVLKIMICLLICINMCACQASNQKVNDFVNANGYKYNESSVKTPNGSVVSTWKYSNELTEAEKKECNEYVSNYYPNAKKLREPTIKYNCHSYAWYSTKKTNKHWINDPSMYWKDNSYKKYSASKGGIPKKVTKNSKVVYWDGAIPIHSAIVVSSDKVKSKWGMCGLYEHAPKDSPYPQSDGTYKLTFYK